MKLPRKRARLSADEMESENTNPAQEQPNSNTSLLDDTNSSSSIPSNPNSNSSALVDPQNTANQLHASNSSEPARLPSVFLKLAAAPLEPKGTNNLEK
jgi:hypothetical protein